MVFKKGKIIREIYNHEIEKITYNPKFGVRDFFESTLLGADSFFYAYNSFAIHLKAPVEDIYVQLTNIEFEKVKNIIYIPIKLI